MGCSFTACGNLMALHRTDETPLQFPLRIPMEQMPLTKLRILELTGVLIEMLY